MAKFGLTAAEKKHLQQTHDAFEQAREQLMEGAREAAERLQAEYDERSEKWQEGEAGEQAAAVLDSLQELYDSAENAELPTALFDRD